MFSLEQVEQIARGAGEILLEKLHSGFSIEHKGRVDLVTDADKASEKFILTQLTTLFPDHSICAEEDGWTDKASEYTWYVDPLDGTTNFAHGFPYFSVSLALAQKGKIILGVVFNPVTAECFSAKREEGAFLNGQALTVSKLNSLQESLLITGFPYDIATNPDNNMRAFERGYKVSQGVRRNGSAALDLCHVASGRVEAFWEKYLKPWDLAAGSLIVEEAGGQITDCQGRAFRIEADEILASNGLIHQELLQHVLA